MLIQTKTFFREPLGVVGMLWPIVLVVPYLPGPPRPSLGGLSWRQEFVFAALLTVTVALLLRRSKWAQDKIAISLDSNSVALVVAATIFTLWIFSSAFWSSNPYSAVQYGFQWAAYLLFFFLIRMVAARPRLLLASLYTLGSAVWLLGISCLIESIMGAPLTDHSLRMTAKPLLRGFSGFSETMAVAAPIFAALALGVRKRRPAVLCGATALFAWLATLQALERAPLLGAAAGFFLLIIGVITLRGCRPRTMLRAGSLAFALVLVTTVQLAPLSFRTADFSANVTALQRLKSTSVDDPSTSVRLLFWATGWEMFRSHPVLGVGANNYEVAFPEARAQFAATHKNSSLVGMNEQLLTQYAHNEYVQILAELGIVGFLFFLAFCCCLILTFRHALKRARRPLLALGSGGGVFAFVVSSGASAFSFRWMGSGLIFFFAAALVSHFASVGNNRKALPSHERAIDVWLKSPAFGFRTLACALAFGVLMVLWTSTQATNGVLHALAQTSQASPDRVENLYLRALRCNPFDAATNYDYGSLLYQQNRLAEAIPHLRYAVDHGINTSTSYAALAAAEEQSKDLPAAERTLAYAVNVYPRSVFLLVRHAATLARMGRNQESEVVFSTALLLDSRAARGWYELINFDIDAASATANRDKNIATPGELSPENAVYVVLKENERRLNISPNTGWRGRFRFLR